jgi:hypothetical protein
MITFDNATAASSSHTVGVGSNRVLVVFTRNFSSALTSVSYGGNAMTQVGSALFNGTFSWYHQTWILINPPTGSNALTSSGSPTYHSASYHGVDQRNPWSAEGKNNTTAAERDIDITTVEEDSWVVGWASTSNRTISFPGAPVSRVISGGGFDGIADLAATTPASTNMIFSATSGSSWYTWNAIAINPVRTTPAAQDFFAGSGADGALVLSTNREEDTTQGIEAVTAHAAAGQADIDVNDGTTFAANDWVLVIQSQGGGAGNYDVVKIQSISTNTLTFYRNLRSPYQSTGAQVIKIGEYSSVNINSGGNWTASNWESGAGVGGVLVAMVSGDLNVNTGGIIDVRGANGATIGGGFGLGHRGGDRRTSASSYQGGGDLGTRNTVSTLANGTGGGGGQWTGQAAGGGGGGHAADGSDGLTPGAPTPGDGGLAVGVAPLDSYAYFGGAGGGGILFAPGGGGGGAAGGGIAIFIVGGNITFTSTGRLDGFGGAAHNGDINDGAGGGGGAGGSVRFICDGTVTLGTGLVDATGGAGGRGQGNGAYGGAGAVGRIATLNSATVAGTSSPTIDTTSTEIILGADPYLPTGPENLKTINKVERAI